MKRKPWTRRTRFAVIAAWLLAIGCSPVFLPLPPPGPPTFSPLTVSDSSGKPLWQTTGDSLPNAARARFYIFNKSMQSGVMVTANQDGSYGAPPLVGDLNDNIELFYVTPAGEAGEVLCVKLVQGRATTPCD